MSSRPPVGLSSRVPGTNGTVAAEQQCWDCATERVLLMLQGMEIVQAIAALPRVKNNTNSPFFQYGKATGAATEPITACQGADLAVPAIAGGNR